MCEAKSTRFFRPWNAAESSGEASEAKSGLETYCFDVKQEREEGGSPFVKVEEDRESVYSVSTCEESSSVASCSENEAARATSERSRRRRRRRSQSSSPDTSTRSCSVNSDDPVESSSLDMLSNFVFNSQQNSYPRTPVPGDARSDAEASTPPGDYRAIAPAYPVDYVQRIAFAQQPTAFTPFESPCMTAHRVDASMSTATPPSVAHPPFYYGIPGGVQFPQGLYPPSVEEAVELIHRQEAVAKQMKKLRPKKFRCEHCDVAFSNNGQLKGHIRIHTGERPFKCDADGCGKSFTRNEELTRHKRIHTGLRPHSCVLCGKRFGRKDHLKKHTRTHDNRDPYRMSAAALGVFALAPHALPRSHPPLPPYVYPI